MKTNVALMLCGRPWPLAFHEMLSLFFSLWQVCHCPHECQSMLATNTVISLSLCQCHEKLWLCLTVSLLNEMIHVRNRICLGRVFEGEGKEVLARIVTWTLSYCGITEILKWNGNLITAQVVVIVYDSFWALIWSCLGYRS